VHGTTGEAPVARFEHEEAATLRLLDGRPSLQALRELIRKVGNDACVDIDTNLLRVLGALGVKLVAIPTSSPAVANQPPTADRGCLTA